MEITDEWQCPARNPRNFSAGLYRLDKTHPRAVDMTHHRYKTEEGREVEGSREAGGGMNAEAGLADENNGKMF